MSAGKLEIDDTRYEKIDGEWYWYDDDRLGPQPMTSPGMAFVVPFLNRLAAVEAERDAEAKACDEARRMMATPGNRSCPLCSATIPRDHDHRLATVQTAREWTAAHDARRAARGKDGDGK